VSDGQFLLVIHYNTVYRVTPKGDIIHSSDIAQIYNTTNIFCRNPGPTPIYEGKAWFVVNENIDM
jgi:hypothetical protein